MRRVEAGWERQDSATGFDPGIARLRCEVLEIFCDGKLDLDRAAAADRLAGERCGSARPREEQAKQNQAENGKGASGSNHKGNELNSLFALPR